MIVVHGLPETLAKLAQVAIVGIAGAEVARVGVATEVANTAKGLVAVDTGALRDSIVVTAEGVEATDEAAIYNEYGTYRMTAQPFMRPAADETDGEEQMTALGRVIGALG